MSFRAGALLLAAGLVVASQVSRAEEVKSGPEDRIGGAFNVKAFTGANKGKTLCYV
jgi:hypothetical protein